MVVGIELEVSIFLRKLEGNINLKRQKNPN